MTEPSATNVRQVTNRRRRRLLIGATIGCAVVIPLCCGLWSLVGGLLAYLFAGIPFVTEDPERVREVTRQIATIDIPPELQPAAGGASRGRWSDRPIWAWVVYADRSSNSYVAFFTDPSRPSVLGGRRDRSRTMVDRYLHEHGYPFFMVASATLGRTTQYITTEANVGGRQVTLDFRKLTDTATGQTWLELFDRLPCEAQDEFICVRLFVDTSKLDEQQVVHMLESIR